MVDECIDKPSKRCKSTKVQDLGAVVVRDALSLHNQKLADPLADFLSMPEDFPLLQFDWALEALDIDAEIRENPHLMRLFDGYRMPNETPSILFRPEWMFAAEQMLREKLPNLAQGFMDYAKHKIPEIRSVLDMITPDLVKNTFRQFNTLLKQYITTFADCATPVMIWHRSGVIHYVNKALRELTGFDLECPTERLAYINQISPGSLTMNAQLFFSVIEDGTSRTLTLPMEFLSYGRYIDVIVSVTMERDSLGNVLLLVGTIVPIIGFPMMESQVVSTAKRLGYLKDVHNRNITSDRNDGNNVSL